MVSILAAIEAGKFACFLACVSCALAWGDVAASDSRQLLRVLLWMLLWRHLWMLLLLLHHVLDRA